MVWSAKSWKNMEYTITRLEMDSEGYSLAHLAPGGGVVSDHPHWGEVAGSHYYPDLTGKEVGDSIEI